MKQLLVYGSTVLLTGGASAQSYSSKPAYIKDLTWEPIDMSVSVIRSFADGLNLYKHLDKLNVCDYHTQTYFTTLVDSIETFWGSEGQTDLIREGIWLFTDSMGLSSYAVRTCHQSALSLDELITHYQTEVGTFPEAAGQAHDNVIKYESELNAQGFGAFVGIFTGRYQDFTYGISHAIYLIMLQDVFQTYVPGQIKATQSQK